jgi:hypothetical protein
MLEQLVVLINLESINAMLINQGLAQGERLLKLNEMAITQMKSLPEFLLKYHNRHVLVTFGKFLLSFSFKKG